MQTFKKILFLLMVACCNIGAQAQVDNYCIRLSDGGTVDCGPMPELDGQSAYTIQFWMKTGTWKDNAVILSRGDGFKIKTTTTNTIEIVVGDKSVAVKNSRFAPGIWTQVTFIYTGSAMRFLVNGNQAVSQKGDFRLAEDGAPFVIGGGFDGCIDELRVWNAVLSDEFNYFLNNTINKYVPQLNNLVAYYKFDQEQCPNIVDYKALFKPGEYNHHGIISGNVTREIVTDNTGLPYLRCGAYTENNKFYRGAMGRDQYLLANDIIILGISMYADAHLEYDSPNDHATLVNADWLSSYRGRSGVLSLKGNGSKMQCQTTTMSANAEITFETWIYLEEWTEGAYIFRKETANQKNGLAIYLGQEDKKQLIVRCNGKKFINEGNMAVGKWFYIGITTKDGESASTKPFIIAFDDKEKSITSSPDGSSNGKPSGMAGETAYIGENLKAKFDQTLIWNQRFDLSALTNHRDWQPMPGLDVKVGNVQMMKAGSAFYKYDKADHPGYDSYSQDSWRDAMKEAFKGWRGYQFRISVRGHKNWVNLIADANNRKRFAADLAKLSEGYDGVELDLEWMYANPQADLRKLAEEILKVLPKDKTLHISVHPQTGAYYYPVWHMPNIDGFTAQNYGPRKENFSFDAFKRHYNAMIAHGYTNDKIYPSYATTTSKAYNDNDVEVDKSSPIGYNWGIIGNNYQPPTNGNAEKAKYDGKNHYFMGPYQVYMRANFCVEKNLQGIFYWDMINDIKPTADPKNYSLAKYCNYGLASNVDTLVTEVDVRHVVTAIKHVNSDTSQELQIRYDNSEQTFSAANISDNEVASMELFTSTGVKIREAKAATVSANSLPAGVYLARVKLKNGQQKSQTIIKK